MRRLVPALLFAFFLPSADAADVGSLHVLLSAEGFGSAKLERRFPNHLVMPVTINGRHSGLMVDTGAPMTIIDRNSLHTLGLTAKQTDTQVGGVWGATTEKAISIPLPWEI